MKKDDPIIWVSRLFFEFRNVTFVLRDAGPFIVTNHVFDLGLKLNSQNIFIWLRINNIWSKAQNQFSLYPSNILLDQAFFYSMLRYKNPLSQNFVHFFNRCFAQVSVCFQISLKAG